jgi:hypothetical protein
MDLTLPIQKNTQREIFDFVETMKNRYEAEITNTIISPPQQQTSTQT